MKTFNFRECCAENATHLLHLTVSANEALSMLLDIQRALKNNDTTVGFSLFGNLSEPEEPEEHPITVFDLDNTINVGKPCRVFDADDNELQQLVWCDISTGETIRLVPHSQGFHEVRETHKAPLRIEWI